MITENEKNLISNLTKSVVALARYSSLYGVDDEDMDVFTSFYETCRLFEQKIPEDIRLIINQENRLVSSDVYCIPQLKFSLFLSKRISLSLKKPHVLNDTTLIEDIYNNIIKEENEKDNARLTEHEFFLDNEKLASWGVIDNIKITKVTRGNNEKKTWLEKAIDFIKKKSDSVYEVNAVVSTYFLSNAKSDQYGALLEFALSQTKLPTMIDDWSVVDAVLITDERDIIVV
jgi:hypothetical protein